MSNFKYHIMYGVLVLFLSFTLIWLFAHSEGQSVIDESFRETVDFSSGWELESGEIVDLSKIGSLQMIDIYEEFSACHTIPDDLEEGQYLCFRSKNVFFKVYLDEELIYEPSVPESKLYTDSPGTNWNYVKLLKEYAGKRLEFRLMKVYESGSSSIDYLCLGEPARTIMDVIKGKLVAFITCILTLFVGVVLIILDIPINMRKQKNHELLYLGLFSLSVATWCLAETYLLQFYFGNSRIIQILSCSSLMLISIPMILYLDVAFGLQKRIATNVMVYISFGIIVLQLFLHLTKIADLHETLHFTHAVLVMAALALIYTIVRNTVNAHKLYTKNVYSILRGIGLIGLSVATGLDVVRFYLAKGSDSAMFVRIGLLIFIICFGSSSLEHIMSVIKMSAQAELISKLAYQDGLTRIGNRTAFEERLTELEKIKDEVQAIAVVMFDVNDLKKINDGMGHQVGDLMLVETAVKMNDAFTEQNGECFRIGGDEFVVLLSGENVQQRYDAGIEWFTKLLEEYNEKNDTQFKISIAYGCSIYDSTQSDKTLADIYKQADMLMYENKRLIKQQKNMIL